MKELPPGLQDHLSGRATTMCFCWRLVRADGAVQGYTNHDRDLSVDGTLFRASTGFTSSQIQASLGLSVDNMTASSAISAETITEVDLAAGRYDDAAVELLWVNWADPTTFVVDKLGSLGEVKRGRTAFTAEVRSESHRLNQKTGRTYQGYCDAVVGDSRCGVDLTSSAYRGVGAVTSGAGRRLTVSGLTGFDGDWFSAGLLTFSSGDNDTIGFEVKRHSKSAGVVRLELWHEPSVAVQAGDAFEVTAGCKNDFATCKDKFANGVNFQGFPFIPTPDVLTQYPIEDGDISDGGSLYGN